MHLRTNTDILLPAHRAQGLGKWLIETAMAHRDLQGLRRWLLATADVHGLFRRFGCAALADPGIYMAIERSPAEIWSVDPSRATSPADRAQRRPRE